MVNRIIIPLEYSDARNQLLIIKEFQSMGFDIFLDLKFHDIPNTVYEAVKSAADHGVETNVRDASSI